MANFKPFVSTDKFSMQTLNNKFSEVVADFNADNAKIDAAIKAVAENGANAAQIAVGTYVGTGASGAEHPNTLTFSFVPKLVLVVQADTGLDLGADGSYWQCSFLWNPGINTLTLAYYTTGWMASHVTFAQQNKSLSWWVTDNRPTNQLNTNGTTYFYLALG